MGLFVRNVPKLQKRERGKQMSLQQMLQDVNIIASEQNWEPRTTIHALTAIHETVRHTVSELVAAIRDPNLEEANKEYFKDKLDALTGDK